MTAYMKKLPVKILTGISCLSIIIVSAAACYDAPDETIENQYRSIIDVFGEKAWTRNRNTTKVSQAYQPYAGTHDIEAFFYLPDGDEEVTVGSGKLKNGILDFTVLPDKLTNASLLEWDYMKAFFNTESGVGAWSNVILIKPANTEVKGNLLLLDAYTPGDITGGLMDRQRFTGGRTSLSCETILYFYVNEDCTIVGNNDSGYRYGQSYYRAGNKLNLPLKKGWNLITRTEKYGTDISGYATIYMEIKPIINPQDYKWVIEKGFRL